MAQLMDNHLICTACGTQFDAEAGDSLAECRICKDPRQFVPPTGQSFTTLVDMKGRYCNHWKRDPKDDRIYSIWTEPKFGIGQRAVLIKTQAGNVLWDLISNLDTKTIDFISSMGGLKAIVISHPHYYATHLVWAEVFDCPVYLANDDQSWLCRAATPNERRKFLHGPTTKIVEGVTAIRCGGHFEGSLVLHWEDHLFIADTFNIVPSGLSPAGKQPGRTTFSFMWSIPNMIPLSPDQMLKIWEAVQPFDFSCVHGPFLNLNIRSGDVKGRILESIKIQTRAEGYESHAVLQLSEV